MRSELLNFRVVDSDPAGWTIEAVDGDGVPVQLVGVYETKLDAEKSMRRVAQRLRQQQSICSIHANRS